MRYGPALLSAVLVAGCASEVKVEATKEEVAPGGRFPHERWTKVLARVNKGGFVDYRALAADHADFDAYLGYLAKYSPWSNPELFPRREDRIAYGINAYNACVMKGVLDHYPVESVQKIGTLPQGFFIEFKYRLGGDTKTLASLEGWVRDFGEPRVHFALNCASIGCPRLPEEAFEPDRLEEQLERERRKFAAEERNVTVEGGVVKLSKIFKWYGGDFEKWLKSQGKPENVLEYVRLSGREVADGKIEFVEYDWGLNEQR